MFSLPRAQARGDLLLRNKRALLCFDRYVSTTLTELAPLTAQDRCDACGAQAYVRVRLPYGELFFCGHHASQHLDKLREDALEIQDERENIA